MTETEQQDQDLNFNDQLQENHRSGFVAVVGKPNVGKSTLMNALLGEKLAIVSSKPQTTRDKQLGIMTKDSYQIVFVDTPGIHIARTSLGEYMVEIATDAIPDADVVLFLVDAAELPTRADESIAEIAAKADAPILLVLNKIDLLQEDEIQTTVDAYGILLPDAQLIPVSALEQKNVSRLESLIVSMLPLGPRYYPPEQLTETLIRDSAAELIREQVLNMYEQEIPHAVAVQVDEFKERSADMIYIRATIFVEKESQKRILIGKGGSALKKLGKAARIELQDMLDSKVYLDLWVKVLKNWRKDEQSLRRLGFS